MTEKRRKPYYVLNRNPDGVDVLHRDPREVCNVDDSEGRQTIDFATADAMLTTTQVRRCRHCWPDE